MTTEQLKSLNIEGLSPTGKFTKDELANFILRMKGELDITKTLRDMEGRLQDANREMEARLKSSIDSLKSTCDQLNQSLKVEKDRNDALSKTVGMLVDTAASQQRYLERMDAKERCKNLIVIGLGEDGMDLAGAKTDNEKIKALFARTCPSESIPFTARRLGTARADGSARPLLIVLDEEANRKLLLDGKVALSKDAVFKDVKIKKDQHPAIRKEWYRLFKAETDEKNKAENAGCTITVDRTKRVLIRDGVVIDRFIPHF